jgi:hypothetical protein
MVTVIRRVTRFIFSFPIISSSSSIAYRIEPPHGSRHTEATTWKSPHGGQSLARRGAPQSPTVYVFIAETFVIGENILFEEVVQSVDKVG